MLSGHGTSMFQDFGGTCLGVLGIGRVFKRLLLVRPGSQFWLSMGPSSQFWSRSGPVLLICLCFGKAVPEFSILEQFRVDFDEIIAFTCFEKSLSNMFGNLELSWLRLAN